MNQAYGDAPPPDAQSPAYAPWDWVPPSWGPSAPASEPQSATDVAPPTPAQIEAPPPPPVTPSTPSPDVPVSTDATGAVTPPTAVPSDVPGPDANTPSTGAFQLAPFGTPPSAQPGDAPASYTVPGADLGAPMAPPMPDGQPPQTIDGLITHPDQAPIAPPGPAPVTSIDQLPPQTEPGAPITEPYQAPGLPPPPPKTPELLPQYQTDEVRARREADMAARDPEGYAQLQVGRQLAKEREANARQLQIATKNEDDARANYVIHQAAVAKTNIARAKLEQDSAALANEKIDPKHWWNNLSTGDQVLSVLGAFVGGLVQNKRGGSNVMLDTMDNLIARDTSEQRASLLARREGIGRRHEFLNDQIASDNDANHAAEVFRIATYDRLLSGLQTDMQNYDPAGQSAQRRAQAIIGVRQMRAQALAANDALVFDRTMKVGKEAREQQLANSTIEKNQAEMAKMRAEAAKLAHAGDGAGAARVAGADPKYTVDTGFTNPFDNTQPLFGVRQIGGKGEDAKERKEVGAAINTYGHVQDYWAKLAAIGDQIDNAKSAGESVWKARKSTLGAEYDAAREALTVYLTKELGDKLTQGQLEAQAHRIPERASLFEARDPGKQIRDAQSDADRDFSRDMTLVGIDPTPVIRSAQQHRAIARPSPVQQLDAANAALADDPTSKDAKLAKDTAEQRVKDEAIAAQNRAGNVAAASTLSGPLAPLPEPSPGDAGNSLAVDHSAAVTAANRSAAKYADLLKQYQQQSASSAHLAGMKQPGDIAAAKRVHEHEVGDLAGEVVKARDQYERDFRKAHEVEATRHLADRVRQAGELVHAGIDPTTGQPLGAAPAPALPDQSYRPGTEPSVPPLIPDPLNTPTYRTTKGKH